MPERLSGQELVGAAVRATLLRQKGASIAGINKSIVKEFGMPKATAARITKQVTIELRDAIRREGLPLALSAEALHEECEEIVSLPRIINS